MERIERAISEGRCVFIFGGRALQDSEVLGELRRRANVPSAILSGEPKSPAAAITEDVLAPALNREGGILCLVEAESEDSVGMNKLATLVAAAPHKPRLVVVARAFNPFALPSTLRMLKFEHEKKKARDFLFPLPAASLDMEANKAQKKGTPQSGFAALAGNQKEAPAPKAAPPAAPKTGAPKGAFIGREEELAVLKSHLDAGGPMVLCGPHGVGRRWLVEKALATFTTTAGQAFKRYPDFSLGWGSESDSLYARIAHIASEIGDKRLAEALRDPANRPTPVALAALAAESLGNSALEGSILVVHHLEHVLRGDGTFHREGRLELLVKKLLLTRTTLRIIFISTLRVRFYREGEGVGLPVIEIGGLKGKELHEFFESWRVENFPRENYGDIINRLHGHPFAARMFAIAVRDAESWEEIMENRRFLQMDNVRHLDPVARRIAKAVESLNEEEKKALFGLAHFRLPFAAADMEVVGVDRRLRIALQAKGLLDQTPDDVKDRSFSVHPLVLAHLDPRERADFQILENIGNSYLERSNASGIDTHSKLALSQEGNRYLFEAHRIRNRARMPYPDNDPSVEATRSLIRGKKPKFDVAEQRIHEVLSRDPANTEMQLLNAELKAALRANQDAVVAIYQDIQKQTPTPEAFHTEATWHQQRNSGRGKAANALERGVEVFPESGRMRRRLAGIYLDQNRIDDAIGQLEEAMRLEPMMPDTYGMLGELYLVKGEAFFDQAETALEEARRLDPDNGLHMARLGAVIVERENSERMGMAEELLKGAVESDKKNYLAHLYLARVVIDKPEAQESDLERANWLLKQALKLDERAALPLVEMARIAIRRANWADATGLLERAARTDRTCHQASFVRGQMYEAQGHIFNADQEYHRAQELAPEGSKARSRYKKSIAYVQALIASGVAIELQKQAEAAGIPVPTEPQPKPVSNRTVRRRGKGGKQEAQAATEAVEGAAENTSEAGSEATEHAPEAEEPVGGADSEEAPSEEAPPEDAEA
jgi:Tfp pilus assembly protein PilF